MSRRQSTTGPAAEDAIADRTGDLREAQQRHREAEHDLDACGRLHRRAARREVATTAAALATAETALADVTRRARPILEQRDQLRTEHQRLQRRARHDRHVTDTFNNYIDPLADATQRLDALDTWAAWARGHHVHPDALIDAAHRLQDDRGGGALLAQPMAEWIRRRDLAPGRPTRSLHASLDHQSLPEPPGLDIGLDIDF